MEAFDDLLMLLPAKMVQAVERHRGFRPEEMRFRIGRAPSLVYGGREHFLPIEKVSEDDLLLILQKATGASLYSAAQAIRQGYYCTGVFASAYADKQLRTEGGQALRDILHFACALRGNAAAYAGRSRQNSMEHPFPIR